MGKWTDRLAEKVTHRPTPPLSKLPEGGERGLLTVLAVRSWGSAQVLAPPLQSDTPTEPCPARRCLACTQRLRAGTSAVPGQSGLITAGNGFVIAWPPAGHAASCAARSATKKAAATTARPYRLSPAQGDAAQAEPWDDGAIAKFSARAADIQRRGFGEDDAEDLAELLHLRDATAEERCLCVECHQLAGTLATGLHCRAGLPVGRDLATVLQRCMSFRHQWRPS